MQDKLHWAILNIISDIKKQRLTPFASPLPEFHRLNIPEGGNWEVLRETTVNVDLAIEKALRGIEQENE